MALEFIMPKLGLTMEEGTILEWLVQDGASITPGMPVLRIETDKVESDVEAIDTGLLHRVGVDGESYPCGAVIGYLLAQGEAVPTQTSTTQAPAAQAVAPVAASTAQAPVASAPAPSDGRILISPNIRRVAIEKGIDLSTIVGSGPDGRIMMEDLETSAPKEIRRMTGMRGTIAKRMHASLQEMAQLTLFMDADLDAVMADRASREGDESVPGFTDYIIAAAARALRLHPIANSQVTSVGIELLTDINVGLAVSLDDGLMVPVVRNTDSLSLAALAVETKRLAAAARSGSLSHSDLEGGTFSVSALGMFGVDGFTPVINPPNVAILGVGRLRDDVVLSPSGAVSSIKRLTLSLTWDHRVLDGAPAAQFCQSIVQLLADPVALNATH
ncbi:MAG: 2-oxo acid dehydrogenase subunit E2 [Ilumatobacteraceae bacterium]|nr:2-oxo acid dehydrogenase subunit E2 [Ilumatobacteraceae bacterium]